MESEHFQLGVKRFVLSGANFGLWRTFGLIIIHSNRSFGIGWNSPQGASITTGVLGYLWRLMYLYASGSDYLLSSSFIIFYFYYLAGFKIKRNIFKIIFDFSDRKKLITGSWEICHNRLIMDFKYDP
jgi:hypothetical protein